jgi:hypothetical protein
MSRRKSATLATLCSDVLSEAKDSAGTWSLATHSRINDVLSPSSHSDVETFISAVIQQILSSESQDGERFKLAQLCTMAKQKQYGGINQIFIRYKHDLLTTAERIQTTPLGVAAARLLQSLFEEHLSQQRRSLASNLRMMASLNPV